MLNLLKAAIACEFNLKFIKSCLFNKYQLIIMGNWKFEKMIQYLQIQHSLKQQSNH